MNGFLVGALCVSVVMFFFRCWTDGIDSQAAALFFGQTYAIAGVLIYGHWTGAL